MVKYCSMATTERRSSSRTAVLEAAVRVVRSGANLSLDSAAKAAGLTKPGLMYHYPTKADLVSAVVDHLLDGYESDLGKRYASQDTADTDGSGRILAYLRWAATYEHDIADLVVFNDPKLRVPMSEKWAERFRPWVEIPAEVSPERRAQLNAVRLIADGCWFADATGILPLSASDREAVLNTALQILKREDS